MIPISRHTGRVPPLTLKVVSLMAVSQAPEQVR
jgi:hypothetical protein